MSKQSAAKATQNYSEKPFAKMCANCAHYTSEETQKTGTFGTVIISALLRCEIGGFKVKKTALCDDWKAKD